MTEMPTIVSERVDDIPLLLAQMRRMDLPTLVDSYFLTHGNRHGLSLGWTVTVWLAHVLSQADHSVGCAANWPMIWALGKPRSATSSAVRSAGSRPGRRA